MLCKPQGRRHSYLTVTRKLSQVIRHSFSCNRRQENWDETKREGGECGRQRGGRSEVRRGARVWAEGLAREPLGADTNTQRCCRELTGGPGAPAGGAGRGLGASFHGSVLTEPSHPPHHAGRAWGPPGWGGQLREAAPGGPTGLGGHSCCEPQGRRKQGKTRRTTFWKTGVAWQRHGKDHTSGTTGS